MRTLDHVGIPTNSPKVGEMYNQGMRLFLTDYSKDANRIEWLRFEKDSTMPQLIQTQTHLAYRVSDPKAEMEGKKILLPPTELGAGAWIAFIQEGDIAVELMWNE